jgi:hypothetical protein
MPAIGVRAVVRGPQFLPASQAAWLPVLAMDGGASWAKAAGAH